MKSTTRFYIQPTRIQRLQALWTQYSDSELFWALLIAACTGVVLIIAFRATS